MFFENDLQFLHDIFKKSYLQTRIASPDEPLSSVIGERAEMLYSSSLKNISIENFIGNLEQRTLYKLTGAYELCYLCLLLPVQKPQILFIGPYLPSPVSKELVLEIGEKNGISPKNIRYLNEYYQSLPIVTPDSLLFSVLNTFCERIWKSPSFSIVDLNRESTSAPFPSLESHSSNGFDDALLSMKAMEMRYGFENEIMQAVALGQIHKESQLFSALSASAFEQRTADPIRNAKNYAIIMNTLLRKAAEQGGVHPIYLDSMSSSFAKKIEQIASASDNFDLMCDMFRSYCRLVRKHAMKDYSPTVQKTIFMIDSDISANLSLAALAAHQNISAGYLSTIFKKETGKTISEYIREKRMAHAAHLLGTTHLQIQTVALHCGIMDVQYFSKLFKKQIGKTPKEYRESLKEHSKS